MTEIDTMTRALSQQCSVSNGNSNNGNNKLMGGRRVSKEEAPLKNFRSRTESVTSNTSENGQKQPSLYKTELCRSFEEHGSCRYGKKCQFAHSIKELRSINRHPKYKTEMCESFHSTGYCPYGSRCHFIHNVPQKNMRKIKSHEGNLSDLRESNPQDPPFTIGAFESEWPKMDSSRHLATTKSLNSVGGSSGSIWQNQSESSFSIFEPVSDLSPFCFDTNNNNSFDESLSWDEGLTLGRLSHQHRELAMEDFNPWEESRLPVFRHLSKHDGETV